MMDLDKRHIGKVLFVCSSNRLGRCSPVVENQANSLRNAGVEVLFYPILGKGVWGYLKHLFRLRHYIRRREVDLVHAHYGLCGVLSSLAGIHPLVVSLMGSDLYLSGWMRLVIRLFSRFFWAETIVKSEAMFQLLKNPRARVLPNGVDLQLFKEMPREEARRQLGFTMPKNVIWASDPMRRVKNFSLAREACAKLNSEEVELRVVKDADTEEMALYLNAGDVLLLTSQWEGSPNVVKEAMACNVPVVSTAVGDVPELIKGVAGCSVCLPRAEDLSVGLKKALALSHRSDGRQRILPLDSRRVAAQMINIYHSVLHHGCLSQNSSGSDEDESGRVFSTQ